MARSAWRFGMPVDGVQELSNLDLGYADITARSGHTDRQQSVLHS